MDAINHVKIHPFPSPSFRTALSKPRNLSYFPLKIRSRPKKGENRPRLRTERLDSWVSKIARLREDTTQKATRNFCPQRHQNSRVTTLQKHRHPGLNKPKNTSNLTSRDARTGHRTRHRTNTVRDVRCAPLWLNQVDPPPLQ